MCDQFMTFLDVFDEYNVCNVYCVCHKCEVFVTLVVPLMSVMFVPPWCSGHFVEYDEYDVCNVYYVCYKCDAFNICDAYDI